MEMSRSVSQLLFSYLPDKTVNWEDGAGIVRLGTARLEGAWPPSTASFVLDEVRDYLEDRKSTRLNSSHSQISYAVFCLTKKQNSTECDCHVSSCGRNRRVGPRRESDEPISVRRGLRRGWTGPRLCHPERL